MTKELSDEVDEQLKKLVDQGILEITNSSFNTKSFQEKLQKQFS